MYQTGWNDSSDQNANILLTSTAYPPSAGNFPTFFSHNPVAHVQFVPGSGGTNFTDTGSTLNTWESYAASRVSGTTYVFRGGTLSRRPPIRVTTRTRSSSSVIRRTARTTR